MNLCANHTTVLTGTTNRGNVTDALLAPLDTINLLSGVSLLFWIEHRSHSDGPCTSRNERLFIGTLGAWNLTVKGKSINPNVVEDVYLVCHFSTS